MHWKPFHRDHPGQVTLSATLGAARPLQLRHAESGYIQEFLLSHGDIFAFTPKINSMFEHGLPTASTESERISLIVWGTVMNITENTPKQKRQLENRDLMETPPRRQCPPSRSRPINDMTSHRPCPPLTLGDLCMSSEKRPVRILSVPVAPAVSTTIAAKGTVAVGDRVQLKAVKDICYPSGKTFYRSRWVGRCGHVEGISDRDGSQKYDIRLPCPSSWLGDLVTCEAGEFALIPKQEAD